MIEVKRIIRIKEPEPTQEKFHWQCDSCGHVNHGYIQTITYLGYIRGGGVEPEVKKRCSECRALFRIILG